MAWKDKPKAEQKADLSLYRAAKRALHDYQAKHRHDHRERGDATYRQLNSAVNEYEREIPWRLR